MTKEEESGQLQSQLAAEERRVTEDAKDFPFRGQG